MIMKIPLTAEIPNNLMPSDGIFYPLYPEIYSKIFYTNH